jgi:hypothetical protein
MYLYVYTDDLAYLMKGLGEIRPHGTLGPYGVSDTVAYLFTPGSRHWSLDSGLARPAGAHL